MSLSAAVIDALVATGATVEQLAAAMKASLAEQEEKVAARREKDAIRQRKSRASRNVTVTSCDTTDEPLSRPPNEINSNPPTHTPEPETRTRKGTRLPANWSPSPLPPELATELAGVSAGAIQRELSKFRDWAAAATGPVAVKSNWDAAWRNWLRKAMENGHLGRNNGPAEPAERGMGSIERAGREALAVIQAQRGDSGSGGPDRAAIDGGGYGRVVALPAPDRSRWDDRR